VKRPLDLLFYKFFPFVRLIFIGFFLYCTTILKTSDSVTSILSVVISVFIIVSIIFRYYYIRNNKLFKETLSLNVVKVIKDNRRDIFGVTKMIIVDFFIVLVAVTIIAAFLKNVA
jgi:hypothetical protein